MKITATISEATAKKLNVERKPVSVEVNIPPTLDEKVKLFGADVVNGAADDALVISVQALMRRMMVPKVGKDGKVTAPASTEAQIQAAVTAWKPDVRSVVRQTAFEKVQSSLGGLTPEQRKQLLADLQKQSAAPAK